MRGPTESEALGYASRVRLDAMDSACRNGMVSGGQHQLEVEAHNDLEAGVTLERARAALSRL